MICYYHFRDRNKKLNISSLESTLTEEIVRASHNYFTLNDRINYLIGRNVIRKALKDLNSPYSLSSIAFTEHGKPFIEQGPNFSISHSNDMVVGVFDNTQKVGVDVEFIRPIDWKPYKEFLSIEDANQIESSEDHMESFFRIWTKKESIVKADGRGMSLSFKDIIQNAEYDYTINGNGKMKWHTRHLSIKENYVISVSAPSLPREIEIRSIQF